MPAIDDVYQEALLAHAGDITRNQRLVDPDASAGAFSRACGSRITVDLKLRDGRIIDYGQEVDACALGSASASIFAKTVVGHTPDELRAARDAMQAMLKKGGPPPPDEWSEFKLLEPARDFSNRHGSMMLPFNATVKALDKLEN